MRSFLCSMILLLACLLSTASMAQQILPDSGKVSLGEHWALLLDPDEALTVADLAQPEVAARFAPQSAPPALGYIRGAAWLRITVTRPATAEPEWWLELHAPTLDEAILYLPRADGSIDTRVAGDAHPRERRDVDFRSPLFKLDLPADTPLTFYVRIKGVNALSFQLLLWSPETFVEELAREQLLLGCFLAIHLLLFLSSLWLFLVTHEWSYGILSLFTLDFFLTALAAEGFLSQYLLSGMPALNEVLVAGSWVLNTPIGVLFIASYVGLLHPPRPRWVTAFVAATWGVALLAFWLFLATEQTWARPAYILWQSLTTATILLIALRLAQQGNRRARVLLLALLPFVLGAFARLARNSGLIDANELVDNAYYLGTFSYLLLANLAVSASYQAMRREKEAAQLQALEASRLAAQELEQRVSSRTRELHESMKQLSASLDSERRAQAEQREFLATVSHELRTPLTIIDTTAQNLLQEAETDAESGESRFDAVTRARYEKILRATRRLADTLEDFLDDKRFSLLGRGAQRQPCDLAALLREAARSAQMLSEQHVFRVDAEDLPAVFVCDPDLTRLVLLSLADNAVKYSPPDSLICLRGERAGRRSSDGIRLEVIDSGPTIPADEAGQVFAAHFRGRNAAGRTGSGMGLTLARRMIQMQGGTLSLKQTGVQGNCFSIWLPYLSVPDGSAAADVPVTEVTRR